MALALVVLWPDARAGLPGAEPGQRQPFALGVEYMVPGLAATYAKTGVQWAKAMGEGFAWGDVEPKPPVNGRHTYDWRNTDRLILEYQRAGFRHLQLYTKAKCDWAADKSRPDYSSRGTVPPRSEFLPYYADYLRNLVERYDKDGTDDAPGLVYPVLHYEIEAEWGTGFWRGTVDEYLAHLRVARAAVKAANPNAQVILIGFFIAGMFEVNPGAEIDSVLRQRRYLPHTEANIRRLLAEADKLLSHPELFDIVEFHSLSDWSEITGMTRFLRQTMRKHGYEKPIWVGDVNYTASPMLFWGIPIPPYTEEQKPAIVETVRILASPRHRRHAEVMAWFRAEQAACLVKKTVLAMGEGCAGINLGNLEDWDIFSFVPTIAGTAAFQGMIDRKGFKPGMPKMLADRIPGAPRPAYHALTLLARKLADFSAVKKLALGQGIHAYTFSVRGSEVTVLWYDDGKRYLPGQTPPSRSVTLTVAQHPYRLTPTPTDQKVPLPSAQELLPSDGKLTLQVGAIPVFLEPWSTGPAATPP
jgi:hypothetical protein